MSYRAIAGFPWLFVLGAMTLLVGFPPGARPAAAHAIAEVVKLLALVGLAAGALSFDRGDYMRRGWGLCATCYGILLVRDAWLLLAPPPVSLAVETARALLILAANASIVTGIWTLARAWQVAGLEPPVSAGASRGILALALSASLVFAGPSLFVDARGALSGEYTRYWTVASDIGDLLALPLLAPVWFTAFAVRDGTLRWPWGLLTASLGAWLVYDAVLTLPELLHISDRSGFRLVAEGFRYFAATSACAAGFAQRRAMGEIDAGRPSRF